MFKSLIVLAGLAGLIAIATHIESAQAVSPPIPCTTAVCSITTNIAWNTSGVKDTRPGTWGTTDSVSSQIPFVNVPAGYLVAITHISGDEIAAPNGTVLPNSMAYGLIGLTNSTPNQSPYVGPGLGSQGTFLYKQTPISSAGARIPINEDVVGTLNADNILIIKQALFLDTAAAPEHFEATVVLQFHYILASTLAGRK